MPRSAKLAEAGNGLIDENDDDVEVELNTRGIELYRICKAPSPDPQVSSR